MRGSTCAHALGRLHLLVVSAALLAACGTYRKLTAPAVPHDPGLMPRVGQVPDAVLVAVLRRAGLVVLGTPVDRISEQGVFTPGMQMGNKQTWYSVRLVVDSVAKGNLGRAKTVDLGFTPLNIVSNQRFARLAKNEIVVQYPETQSPGGRWGGAPLLFAGERAVYIFRKCYYCVELGGVPTRGPYYKAHPWVAMTWASKLPPEEWPRVVRLLNQGAAGLNTPSRPVQPGFLPPPP
ncbi:MAG TPA: hypothetical protein VFU46_10750 [Gemmatimonadales bacterium]|nr:hypothetical protein [Gemmatimonadales bacterium]